MASEPAPVIGPPISPAPLPTEVTVPVLVRYGASDVLVPPGHGAWLAAHVPGCVVKIDDAGHLGRDPVEELAEDVRWLRDGTPPA